MITLQYFDGTAWTYESEWHHEASAWISLGLDNDRYRTLDRDLNVLTDNLVMGEDEKKAWFRGMLYLGRVNNNPPEYKVFGAPGKYGHTTTHKKAMAYKSYIFKHHHKFAVKFDGGGDSRVVEVT